MRGGAVHSVKLADTAEFITRDYSTQLTANATITVNIAVTGYTPIMWCATRTNDNWYSESVSVMSFTSSHIGFYTSYESQSISFRVLYKKD